MNNQALGTQATPDYMKSLYQAYLGEDYKHFSRRQKQKIINKNFKTETGINLAEKLYL